MSVAVGPKVRGVLAFIVAAVCVIAASASAQGPVYGDLCKRHPTVKPCVELRRVCEDAHAPNRYRVAATCRALSWLPTKTPSATSNKAPTKTLAKAPTKAPTKPPTKTLAKPPAKTPTKPPTKTLAKPPTKTLAKASTKAPARPPTKKAPPTPPTPPTAPPTKASTTALQVPPKAAKPATSTDVSGLVAVVAKDIADCRENPVSPRCASIYDMCEARRDYVWGGSFRVCEELGWLGIPNSVANPLGRTATLGARVIFNSDESKFGVGRMYGINMSSRIVGQDWPWAALTDTNFAFGGGKALINTTLAGGVGLKLNSQLSLAIVAGGTMQATGEPEAPLDFSVPVELFVTAYHGLTTNVTAHARSHFLIAGKRPGGGPPSVPFGDEFNAGVTVHFLHPTRPFRQHDYYGFAVSAEYREWIGTRFVGLGFAWALPSRYVFEQWLNML